MADKPKALHAKQRPNKTRVFVILAVAVAVIAGGVTLTYVLGDSSPSSANNASGSSGAPTTIPLSLAIQPPDGATNVALDSVVSVTAMTGRITSVTVAGSDGSTLSGTVSSDGTAWHSSGTLALQTNYTVTVDATMPGGRAAQQVTHFGSLVPTAVLTYTITPAQGLTVGVAEPIVLRFNHPVVNQTAMLSALQVTESTPVTGGWHWFSSRELHFRPEVYWPTGEQVSVAAHLAGFDAGNGIYAMSNATTNFAVGDSHISTANTQTHMMTVTDNGKVVYTFPISTGRTVYPTMNGIHIDLYRQYDVHMVSSTVGIPVNSADGYDEHVFWDVNISDGGEYVHAAPWSLGAQGRSNVSHGCVNLSPANAEAFYNFSRIGDVIQVVGSPRAPSLGDHGTMDWNTPWSAWTTTAATTAPAAPTTTVTTTAPTTVAPATTVPAVPTTVAPATTTAVPTTTTTTAPLAIKPPATA